MGTVERGESNLSLQNIAKVATGLGITLSQLFAGIEKNATKLEGPQRGETRHRPKG